MCLEQESCDVLGTNTGHVPCHSKRYADFAGLYDELQRKRVAAFEAFAVDVASGGYPETGGHQVTMNDNAYEEFLKLVEP